jgi:hypothetical protein
MTLMIIDLVPPTLRKSHVCSVGFQLLPTGHLRHALSESSARCLGEIDVASHRLGDHNVKRLEYQWDTLWMQIGIDRSMVDLYL